MSVAERESPPDDEAHREFLLQKQQGKRVPVPASSSGDPPEWAKIPANLTMPTGRQVVFVRFRSEWTDTPAKGERQAILWPINDADEKLALGRALQDPNRVLGELSKQMIRAVDGHVADWAGGPSPGSVEVWWNEVGQRCRTQLTRLYSQLHMLNEDDQLDFFENCIAVRTASG